MHNRSSSPKSRPVPTQHGGAHVVATRKIRSFALLAAALTVLIYWGMFLGLPIGEGINTGEGEPVTRGAFLLSAILIPDSIISTWFDGGRLPTQFFDRIPIAILTVLWLACGWALGNPLVRAVWHGSHFINKHERTCWSILVGLALLSTLVLLVGCAGGLQSRWPLLAVVVASIAGSQALGRYYLNSTGSDESKSRDFVEAHSERTQGVLDRALTTLTIGMTLWAGAVIQLGAWVPSSEFDVNEYHLQAPKEFYQQGSIGFVPHNVYANMPLGAEMHTLAMMTLIDSNDPWWGGLIGKSLTASIFIIAAILLGVFVRSHLGTLSGWAASAMWLSSPGMAHVSMLGLIDGVTAAYLAASAMAVVRSQTLQTKPVPIEGLKPTSSSHAQVISWLITALLSGAAAATKYPGLIFAVMPVLGLATFYVVITLRKSLGSANASRMNWQIPMAMLLGWLLTCGPWYAKNWMVSGNPVYPLAANVFGGHTLTEEKIDQWQRAHAVPTDDAVEGTNRWVASVRAAGNDLRRLVLSSPFVQPAMICCLLFGVALLVRDQTLDVSIWRTWFVWSMWIIAVWWFATHRIDRFWLPMTGLWAGIGAWGWNWMRSHVSPWLAHVVLIPGLLYGCLLNSSPLVSDSRYFVALQSLRDDEGDERQIARVSPQLAWINKNLDPVNTKVLMIGEAAVFEYRVPLIYSTCFDLNPAEQWLRGKSAAEQRSVLHDNHITHVLINWNEIDRYRSPGNYGFSDWPQQTDSQSLQSEGVLERIDWPVNGVELFKVREEKSE